MQTEGRRSEQAKGGKGIFRGANGKDLLKVRAITSRRKRSKQRIRSLEDSIAPIDGRSRLGKDVRAFRQELWDDHCGGHPTASQRALIALACQLKMRIAVLDGKFAEAGEQCDTDTRHYLAHVNALRRAIADLGPPAAKPANGRKSLSEIIGSGSAGSEPSSDPSDADPGAEAAPSARKAASEAPTGGKPAAKRGRPPKGKAPSAGASR
jgi:hypothetical protein